MTCDMVTYILSERNKLTWIPNWKFWDTQWNKTVIYCDTQLKMLIPSSPKNRCVFFQWPQILIWSYNTKFQGHRAWHGRHLGYVTRTIWATFVVPPSHRSSVWNLTLNGPVVSEEKIITETSPYKSTVQVAGRFEGTRTCKMRDDASKGLILLAKPTRDTRKLLGVPRNLRVKMQGVLQPRVWR